MTFSDILALRLYNQHIINQKKFKTPAEVVDWLGAFQAQDYYGSLWSIGLRLQGITEADVEKAVEARTIARTWPMRGTLHFVPPADLHWMVSLMAPRIISGAAKRYRDLELDDKVFSKSRKVLIKALEGGRQITRSAAYELLESEKIRADGQRGIHILSRFAMEGLLCFGPRDGKQFTFVLLEEWIPNGRKLAREEALARIAKKYFTGHGPATLKDFSWWTGLPITEARKALEMVRNEFESVTVDDQEFWFVPNGNLPSDKPETVFLLPGFDEFMLGYTNRDAMVEKEFRKRMAPGNGMFSATVVVNGKVEGTWKREIKKDKVSVQFQPFRSFSAKVKAAAKRESKRYANFLGLDLTES